MFSPRRRIASFSRSRKRKQPSLSRTTRSPRVEPEVAPALDGLLGQAPVARREREGLVRAQHELARRAVGLLLVVRVDDLHLVARHRTAHRSPAAGCRRARRSRRSSRSSRSRRAGATPKRSRNSSCSSAGVAGASAIAHAVRCSAGDLGGLGEDRDHRAEQVGDRGVGLERRAAQKREAEKRCADDELGAVDQRLDAARSARSCGRAAGRCRARRPRVSPPSIAAVPMRPPVELRLRAHHALRRARSCRRCRGSRRCRPDARPPAASAAPGAGKPLDREPPASRRRGSPSRSQMRSSEDRQLLEHLEVLEERPFEDEDARAGVGQHVLQLRPARRQC